MNLADFCAPNLIRVNLRHANQALDHAAALRSRPHQSSLKHERVAQPSRCTGGYTLR